MDVERSNTGQIVKYILFNYVSLIMLILKVYIYIYMLISTFSYTQPTNIKFMEMLSILNKI